jgi:hypothetical protein
MKYWAQTKLLQHYVRYEQKLRSNLCNAAAGWLGNNSLNPGHSGVLLQGKQRARHHAGILTVCP